MKTKKYITAALALLLLTTLLAPLSGPAEAASMTSSEAVIEFIKEYEGFRSYVYWDGGNAYIGYGTIVYSKDYPNGISREGADALLREALAVKEAALNKAMDKYGFTLTQNQFDAMMSFTYNIGTGWMSTKNRIFRYLTEGAHNHTDLEMVNAIGAWCRQGGQIVRKLVERRLREAVMFVYGQYDGFGTHEYRYIVYDAGAGEVEYSMVFYEYGKPYGPLQEAVRGGYTLTGWVTDSGTAINAYTVANDNIAVTAVWTEGTVTVPADLTNPAEATPPASVYSDVSEDDWYYDYVVKLSQSGIFSGFEDGTFKPDDNVTCGQALKLILRAVGFDVQPQTGGHWASGYLTLAESKGIANGADLGGLDAEIDRQTVAELAAKSVGLPPLDPETVFTDTQDGFVLALYRCGILTGSGEAGGLMFHPDKSITRAELSAVLWRLCSSDVIPR